MPENVLVAEETRQVNEDDVKAVLFADGELPASFVETDLLEVTSTTLGAIVARRC